MIYSSILHCLNLLVSWLDHPSFHSYHDDIETASTDTSRLRNRCWFQMICLRGWFIVRFEPAYTEDDEIHGRPGDPLDRGFDPYYDPPICSACCGKGCFCSDDDLPF
jgi:hypothetical protein